MAKRPVKNESSEDLSFWIKQTDKGSVQFGFAGTATDLQASLAGILAKHPDFIPIFEKALRGARVVIALHEAGDDEFKGLFE